MGAKSSSRLKKLDISSQSNQLNAETMFLGVKAQSVIRKSTKKDFVVKGFMKQVNYLFCFQCITSTYFAIFFNNFIIIVRIIVVQNVSYRLLMPTPSVVKCCRISYL